MKRIERIETAVFKAFFGLSLPERIKYKDPEGMQWRLYISEGQLLLSNEDNERWHFNFQTQESEGEDPQNFTTPLHVMYNRFEFDISADFPLPIKVTHNRRKDHEPYCNFFLTINKEGLEMGYDDGKDGYTFLSTEYPTLIQD